MFGLGPQELFIILIIVLLIFGSKRLPEIGKAFGKSIREFKKATRKEDELSTWIDPKKSADRVSAADREEGQEQSKDSGQPKLEDIPGVKEAREIRNTANKIKAAGKFFLKK
ncbi:MAG: twin-arginine translocase TatA/TatE family subunit [Deltaproteobacteria bacterium]|nr:twin-arginine translocase TatA/TatE family subunit [Deltaproteobacteria bacterium]MBW2072793.1 twin-arginine translocase TatA/TatE family subunit [Deltaproteobacteria bacterium]